MADYIDRSILCESYIFVEDYDLTQEKKALFEAQLLDYAKSRAPIFFGSDVQIESEAIEGSLKLKVTVVATLTNLFIFYGSIRQSIDYLYKDAQTVASAFITESMFVARVKSNEVSRTEVRTGVPGALKRVIAKIDTLEKDSKTISPDDFSAELAGIRAELARILATIPSEEDQETVATGFIEILEQQYPDPTDLPKEENGRVPAAIQRRDDIVAFLTELKKLRKKS